MPHPEPEDECGCGQHQRVELPIASAGPAPARIGPQMTVRQILAVFPGTAEVFDRHGLMGCGGERGPEEPLDLFARAHHIDVAALLHDLQAAGSTTEPTQHQAPRPAAPPPARYRRFIASSLGFALTFGAGLGALLLGTNTLPSSFLGGISAAAARTAHAHAQVFGFAALFVMGVAYHAVPRIKSAALAAPRLVAASYWLQAGGVLLVAVGVLAPAPLGAATHVLGAVALLGAALAFGRVIDRTLASGPTSPERFEPWLRSGCAWLVVAAALTLAAAAGASPLQPAVWEAALYGFAASWVFGFSLRLLPVFMGIAPAPRGRGGVCVAYQAAVGMWVGVAVLSAWWLVPPLRAVAGVALAAAGAVAVWRLRVFAAREVPGAAVDRGYEKFVLFGYAWLLVGLLCGPAWSAGAAIAGVPMPALVLDFGRHAITLGFLTQMVIGIATRIIPVFSGKALWSPRWRAATFYVLNAAVLVRGLQVVVELGGPEGAWPWIAVSGVLGFAAFAGFALNLGMTLAGRGVGPPRGAVSALEPSAGSVVADLLAIPGALDLLVARGFAPLRNPVMRATMAHAVTLGQACRMHGIAVEPLVSELRALTRAVGSDAQSAPAS